VARLLFRHLPPQRRPAATRTTAAAATRPRARRRRPIRGGRPQPERQRALRRKEQASHLVCTSSRVAPLCTHPSVARLRDQQEEVVARRRLLGAHVAVRGDGHRVHLAW